VRIVAAMAAEPSIELRPDLFYRLNVVSLKLPPLRQREGDIALLCQHFLDKLNARFGTRVTGITPSAARLLEAWPWPGNIRELANLLEGILNFRTHGQINAGDLPEFLDDGRRDPIETSLRAELERVEKRMIFHAMEVSDGNVSRAALKLGLPRQTLQRKLRKTKWHDNCIGQWGKESDLNA
jgi:arginine utilization regulatory protein